MSLQHNMYFESGLLRIDASGEFLLEDAKHAFLELLGAVVQYKADKVLLDGRNVTGKPGDMERFYYGEFVAGETHRISLSTRLCRGLRMFCMSLFVTRQG